jgi:hypothetical protein
MPLTMGFTLLLTSAPTIAALQAPLDLHSHLGLSLKEKFRAKSKTDG